jgi:hypothetical protein
MPMPPAVRDEARRRVAAFCDSRVPVDLRGELRLEHAIRGSSITIVERRPPFSVLVGADWTSMKIAQLRYGEDSASGRCTHPIATSAVSPRHRSGSRRRAAAGQIAEDPTGIFWG